LFDFLISPPFIAVEQQISLCFLYFTQLLYRALLLLSAGFIDITNFFRNLLA